MSGFSLERAPDTDASKNFVETLLSCGLGLTHDGGLAGSAGPQDSLRDAATHYLSHVDPTESSRRRVFCMRNSDLSPILDLSILSMPLVSKTRKLSMRTDPATSTSPFGSGQPGSTAAGERRVDEAYAQRVASLFEEEYMKLVSHMAGRTRSWAEARDVAAQAFVHILELDDPRTVSFLKSYLYRTAHNIHKDRLKVAAIRERIDHIARYEPDEGRPSLETELNEQQRCEVLQRAIATLSPTRKFVVVLRLWDELTYGEIAARLAAEYDVVVDERTVHNWYESALEQLRQVIERVAADLKGGGIE